MGFVSSVIFFILAAPVQQHAKYEGRYDFQSARGKKPPKKNLTTKSNYNKRAHINGIKGITRICSSGDQRECVTDSHMSPTREDHVPRRQGVKADNLIHRNK